MKEYIKSSVEVSELFLTAGKLLVVEAMDKVDDVLDIIFHGRED